MSATRQHGNIAGTAVKIAPGLWRTSLQRYDLFRPRTRDDPVARRYRAGLPRSGTPIRVRRSSTALATDIVDKGKPLLTAAQ
jgi:hypothetical protein